jgi:hypothetical protein
VGVGVEVVVGAGVVAADDLRLRFGGHLHLHPHLLVGIELQPRRRRLREPAVGVAVVGLALIHLPLAAVPVAPQRRGEEARVLREEGLALRDFLYPPWRKYL